MSITKEWLKHSIDIRRFPNAAKNAEAQKGVNAARFARVEKAMYRLPVYLPLSWNLPAAGSFSPIPASTPNKINYDVIIVGAISDSPLREVRFKGSDNEINPSVLGKSENLRLTLGDIAGTNEQNLGSGYLGISYFTSPYLLPKGSQITLEMFKGDVTPNDEVANLVFIGYRIFSERNAYTGSFDDEIAEIKAWIERREVPRQTFLKQEVIFDAGGFANDITTPNGQEPLIVRGVRSTLTASLVTDIKIRLGMDWAIGDVPSWAIFCEPNSNDNYLMFKEPLYLPARAEIQLSLRNQLPGSAFPDANGSITWLCETV